MLTSRCLRADQISPLKTEFPCRPNILASGVFVQTACFCTRHATHSRMKTTHTHAHTRTHNIVLRTHNIDASQLPEPHPFSRRKKNATAPRIHHTHTRAISPRPETIHHVCRTSSTRKVCAQEHSLAEDRTRRDVCCAARKRKCFSLIRPDATSFDQSQIHFAIGSIAQLCSSCESCQEKKTSSSHTYTKCDRVLKPSETYRDLPTLTNSMPRTTAEISPLSPLNAHVA